jgi:endonuclease YncB( thermonuclease family)
MPKFPADRVYRRRGWRPLKTFAVLLLFVGLLLLAWFLEDYAKQWDKVATTGQRIMVADGDSFAIGTRKLRLRGIDAPEYQQTCKDAIGADWPCGRSARAALEKLLTEPGLACEAEARDRYARSLATCQTAQTPDIAAKQVRDGMAVSDEYFGSRSFGDEEDKAQSAKRGIWQGAFVHPADYRAQAKEPELR